MSAPADGLAAAFDPAGARALADSLEPGTALAFLLVEHYWAERLFDAIAETGGTLIGEGFLTAETGLVVGAEVAAMEEAAEVIAQAQADEASAVLAAVAAQAEAAEAVAESQRIQSAAAADAVQALITAGLVEEAAAHEAVMALTAAGLIVAAADQAAADAIAEDIATGKPPTRRPVSPWRSPSSPLPPPTRQPPKRPAKLAHESGRRRSPWQRPRSCGTSLHRSPFPLSPTSWASPGPQPGASGTPV